MKILQGFHPLEQRYCSFDHEQSGILESMVMQALELEPLQLWFRVERPDLQWALDGALGNRHDTTTTATATPTLEYSQGVH